MARCIDLVLARCLAWSEMNQNWPLQNVRQTGMSVLLSCVSGVDRLHFLEEVAAVDDVIELGVS